MADEIMADLAAPGDTGLRAVRGQIGAIARLGAPVALSRVGMLLLIVVDVAMVGRHSSFELAYFGLANAVHLVLFLLGVGMLIGAAVLTAQAAGAGAERECGVIWRTAALHALALGAIFLVVSLAGGWF
jgi:MATE family multidrug resistance protein